MRNRKSIKATSLAELRSHKATNNDNDDNNKHTNTPRTFDNAIIINILNEKDHKTKKSKGR